MRPRSPAALLPAHRCCAAAMLLVVGAAGCAPGIRMLSPVERAVAEAARPILEMNPDAVWTDSYNRLLDLAPASVTYLATHPTLCQPAPADDLRVLIHTSLLRALLHPAIRPHLSTTCLETTLDVLHFDLKVDGREVGELRMLQRRMPQAWHDLYPARFDQELAGRIDVEADRLTLRAWWRSRGESADGVPIAGRLTPRPETLWHVLSRQYADRWSYQPTPQVLRCTAEPVLVWAETYEYNLVRAACVWLGSSPDPDTRSRLIDLLGDRSPIVSHNALVALQYVPDDRIHALIERYKSAMDGAPSPAPADRSSPPLHTMIPSMLSRSRS